MPLPFAAPLLTAGAGSTIPISGGPATSGPATSGGVAFAPVNLGGLFAGDIDGNMGSNLTVPLLIGGAIIVTILLLGRR